MFIREKKQDSTPHVHPRLRSRRRRALTVDDILSTRLTLRPPTSRLWVEPEPVVAAVSHNDDPLGVGLYLVAAYGSFFDSAKNPERRRYR